MKDLHQEVTKAEIAERVKRGHPPDHVLDMAHFPFAFAPGAVATFNTIVNQLAAEHPDRAHLAMSQVMAALALRDYAGANAAMDRYRALAPSEPNARMRFGHVPEGPFVELPPVEGAFPEKPCFFLACDQKYFEKYCVPLLRSMAASNPGLPVHVHLMSGSRAAKTAAHELPLDLTVSSEDPSQLIASLGISASHYYGAARLIRFAAALETNPGPLWMADVDGVVTGDLRPLLGLKMPAALRVRAGRLEPWHQFSACLVMGNPAGLPYFRRVAAIVAADLPAAWWGLDQYALFSAAIGAPPHLGLIGPDVAGIGDRKGLFWFTAGANKTELATADTPYAAYFRQFAG